MPVRPVRRAFQVMRFLRSRCITRAKKGQLVAALRERLSAVSENGKVSPEDEEALKGLENVCGLSLTVPLLTVPCGCCC